MPLCRLLLTYFERLRPTLRSVLWKEKAPGQVCYGDGTHCQDLLSVDRNWLTNRWEILLPGRGRARRRFPPSTMFITANAGRLDSLGDLSSQHAVCTSETDPYLDLPLLRKSIKDKGNDSEAQWVHARSFHLVPYPDPRCKRTAVKVSSVLLGWFPAIPMKMVTGLKVRRMSQTCGWGLSSWWALSPCAKFF